MDTVDQKIYVNVYFRIEVGYKWGEGMGAIEHAAFETNIKKLLTNLGFNIWPEGSRSASQTCKRGVEHLYCHPMDLSGYVLKDKIQEIEDALKAHDKIGFRMTDTFRGDVFYYTEKEFTAALNEKKTELENDILEACKTKRRNLYKNVRQVLECIKINIPSFDKEPYRGWRGTFIWNTFLELVEQGKIIRTDTAKGGDCCRSAKEKDLLQKTQNKVL